MKNIGNCECCSNVGFPAVATDDVNASRQPVKIAAQKAIQTMIDGNYPATLFSESRSDMFFLRNYSETPVPINPYQALGSDQKIVLLSNIYKLIETYIMSITEWKICCALDEQHWRSLLARLIGWQVTDKYKKPFRSRSLDESIGTGVSE